MSCCKDGLKLCVCREGLNGLGETCSLCKGLGRNFCMECQQGSLIEKSFYHYKHNDDSEELQNIRFELYKKISNLISSNMPLIHNLCQKTYMDPFFLLKCIEEEWTFNFNQWPKIFLNDPRPFNVQFNSWVEQFSKGVQEILPQQYDLKILVQGIALVLEYDIQLDEINAIGSQRSRVFKHKASVFLKALDNSIIDDSLIINRLNG